MGVSGSVRYFWPVPAVLPLFEFRDGPDRAGSFGASGAAAAFQHDGQCPQ